MPLYGLLEAVRDKLAGDSVLSDAIRSATGMTPAIVVEGAEKDMVPPAFLVGVEKVALPRVSANMPVLSVRITGYVKTSGNGLEVCMGAAERIGELLRVIDGGKVRSITLNEVGEQPEFGWGLSMTVEIDATA